MAREDRLVGTNFHVCLEEIVSGEMPLDQVAFIFTNFPIDKWEGKGGWLEKIDWWEEKKLYHKDLARVRVILESLFHSGRLVSPRCVNKDWSVWLEEEAGNPLWLPMNIGSLLDIRWMDDRSKPSREYLEGLVLQFASQ